MTGCAPAAQSPAPAETQQTAEPQAAAAEEPAAPEQSAEQQPEQSDTITVTDHNDNVVTVPRRIDRIVVCDILPLLSVLSVFFDSAENLVGIAPSSMSAAQNSLLSQLYPEILNAETGFMNGTDVNTEELMKLAPDVVFYSAMNPSLGESCRPRASAPLPCRRTSGNTTASRRSTTGLTCCLPSSRKMTAQRCAGSTARKCTTWCSSA